MSVPNNTDLEWKHFRAIHPPACTTKPPNTAVPHPPYLADGSVTIHSNITASAAFGLPKQGD